MKVEYVTSTLGVGTELHISAAEYKRVNSEAGWADRQNLLFALNAYLDANQCTRRLVSRDVEEAFRHIKKNGTIVLATKTDGMTAWCEVYAVTDGEIIPVVTSRDGLDYTINMSAKTKRQAKQPEENNAHD